MSPSRRSCRDVRYRAVRHGAVGCPTQEGPTLIIRDRPQVGGYSYPIRFVPRVPLLNKIRRLYWFSATICGPGFISTLSLTF